MLINIKKQIGEKRICQFGVPSVKYWAKQLDVSESRKFVTACHSKYFSGTAYVGPSNGPTGSSGSASIYQEISSKCKFITYRGERSERESIKKCAYSCRMGCIADPECEIRCSDGDKFQSASGKLQGSRSPLARSGAKLVNLRFPTSQADAWKIAVLLLPNAHRTYLLAAPLISDKCTVICVNPVFIDDN